MLRLIRGLPGSGKSTAAQKMLDDYSYPLYMRGVDGKTFVAHYEANMYHIDPNGNYVFDIRNIADADAWCQEKTRKELVQNNNVIVSNTFTTHRELQPYIDMAIEYDTQYEIYRCNGNFGSIHNVPVDTMNKMRSRFIDFLDENIIDMTI